MIIDSHAHLYAPDSLYAYRANLLADGGYHPLAPRVSESQLKRFADKNVEFMDGVGTDVQLLSPRPYHAMNSVTPARVLEPWTKANNDLIARMIDLHPTRFAGVAGLPLVAGHPVDRCFPELDRAIEDLGFVGVVINPDLYEGRGGHTPGLGDEYWFPLFEKLQALDVPALIHPAACFNDRETYSEHFITEESIAVLSLLRSDVFERFPDLRLVIAHGGGSVPYQIGRWEAERAHAVLANPGSETFLQALRHLWFDTVLHNPPSLEFLIRTVGSDRCLFGTERPGSGTAPNSATGRDYDDIKPVIDEMSGLDDSQKRAIFTDNALQVYPRLAKTRAGQGASV